MKINTSHMIEKNRKAIIWVVLLALFALSFVPFFVVRNLISNEENKVLAENNYEVGAAAVQYFDQLRAPTRGVGVALSAEDTPAIFSATARPLVVSGQYLGIGLIDTNGIAPKYKYSEGSAPKVGTVPNREILDKVQAATGLKANSVIVDRDSPTPHLITIQGAIAPAGTYVYSEVPLSRITQTHGQVIFDTEKRISHNLYLGRKADPSQLIASNDRMPSNDKHFVQSVIQSGGVEYLVTSQPAEPVLDLLTRLAPLLLLIGGMLVALAFTWLLRHSLNRNEEVIRNANERDAEALAILDAAHEAFFSVREDGTIARCSRTTASMFGWTTEELLHHNVFDLFIPKEYADENGGVSRLTQLAETNSQDRRFEINLLTRDGKTFPVEMIIWEGLLNGEPSFKILCRDITERRAFLEEISQSRKEALDASRLKSEFLANMSHEIRTPMNGVIGMTDLLMRTKLDTEQRDYAETVRTSAESLLTVINDILDFTKIEAGKLAIETADFDLRSVVQSSVVMLADAADAKGLELVCTIDDDVPVTVGGDAHRLRQVLINLVNNAVKFTNQGEVVISTSVAEQDAETATIRFAVRDTGIGIPEEGRKNLFNSFEQVDMSSSRRHEGTGLGLAIAKRIVELMHGEIGFTSSEGVGSTFWFTAKLQKSQLSISREESSPLNLTDMRLLIVDDNSTNRTMLQRLAKSWNMRATVAANSDQAFEEIKSAIDEGDPIKLMLLDQHMMNETGMQFAQRLKGQEQIPSINTVLLTSSSDTFSNRQLNDAGIALSMNKPVRHDLLRGAIAEAMSPNRPRAHVPPLQSVTTVVQGARVLLVEDHPVNQRVASLILGQAGCDVEVVSSGAEAVEAVKNGEYSLVFMDCQMPGMDGYEATRLIRESEKPGSHLPIVALTASAMKGDREKALAAGMDDHLPKPVRNEEVIAQLQKWLECETKMTSPATPATATTPTSETSEVVITDNDPDNTESQVYIFDRKVLANLRLAFGGNDAQLHTLLNQFILNGRDDLEKLRLANLANDSETISRTAHKIKGGSATIGAMPIVECAQQIEQASTDRLRLPVLLNRIYTLLDAAAQDVSRIEAEAHSSHAG